MKLNEKMLKDATAIICCTDKGSQLTGDTAILMAIYAVITQSLLQAKNMNKQVLSQVFEFALNKKLDGNKLQLQMLEILLKDSMEKENEQKSENNY